MPDESTIIGKVAVKVIPDTSKFGEELKEQLEKIEKNQNKKPLEITVVLDGDKLNEEAKKLREEVQAKLKKAVTLKVNLDNQESVQAGIARLQAELVKLGEKSIPVRLNKTQINKQLASLRKRLKEIASIKLSVNKRNQDSLRRAIDQLDAELEKLAEVTIDVKLDKASLAAKKKELEAELAKIATLDLKINKRSESSVKAAIKAIDAELQKLGEVDLKIKLNEADLKKEKAKLQKLLDDAAKAAQKAAEKELQDGFKRSKKLVDDAQKKLNEMKFAPKADKDKLAETKAEIEAVLIKIAETEAKIGVELDPLKKRKLELEVAELQARIGKLTVSLEPKLDKKKAAEGESLLDFLARTRKVVFKPVVKPSKAFLSVLDRLSGWRAGRDFMDSLKNILFNLDLSLPKLSSYALGIGGVGAAAMAASGQLFALSAALAEIVQGMLIALPGAFISLAVAVGTAYVALQDFKKVLPDITKLYGGLKKTISDNFWRFAEAPLRRMAKNLFPQIEAGLKHVSGAMGLFFGEFSKSLEKVFGNGVLQDMFDNVAKGILNLVLHTDAFARIFRVLGTIGSQYFEFLMEALGEASEGWANWLEEAERTGELYEMVRKATRNLVNLGRIGKNLFLIFSDLADAYERAFGKEILQAYADGLDRIRKITSSSEFQKEMTEVFAASNAAMRNIIDVAGPALETAFKNLGDLVEDVFPVIGTTIGEILGGVADAFNNPAFLAGVRGLFDSLMGFAEKLRPAWDGIGGAIGSVLGLIQTFIDTASPGVATAIQNLAGWISTLAEAMRPIAAGLGKVLSDTLDRIAPGVTKIVNAIKSFAEGDGGAALVGFFEDLSPLIGSIADWLGKAATELAKWANENLPKIREDLGPIIDDFKEFIDDHGDRIIEVLKGIGDALATVVGWLSDMSPAIAELTAAAGIALLVTKLSGLRGAISGIAWVLKSFPKAGVWGVIFGLAAMDEAMDPNEAGAVQQFFSPGGYGQEQMDRAKEQIGKWLEDLEQSYYDFGDRVREDFTETWDGLEAERESRGDTFAENWDQFWSEVGDGSKSAWDNITGLFGGHQDHMRIKAREGADGIKDETDKGFFDILTGVTDAITNIGKMVADGYKGLAPGAAPGISALIDETGQIKPEVLKALGATGSTLTQAGMDLIVGLINGIEAKKQALLTSVNAAANAVASKFKAALGIHSPSRVFKELGQYTMDGLRLGMESRYSGIKKSLSGFADDLSGTGMGTLQANVGVRGRLPAIADGTLAGGPTNSRVLNYYAAPGSSISAEEDLFAAGDRSRMMGW